MNTKEKANLHNNVEENYLKQERALDSIYYQINELDDEKKKLLWEILFEADFSDKNLMRDLVYKFGSSLKGNDKFGRLIFIRLASLF